MNYHPLVKGTLARELAAGGELLMASRGTSTNSAGPNEGRKDATATRLLRTVLLGKTTINYSHWGMRESPGGHLGFGGASSYEAFTDLTD